jgi:hypothetical protein
LATYPVPTRGFTAVVSVFGGTPSNKPFRCKLFVRFVRLVRSLRCIRTRAPIGCVRAHRAGGRFDPAAFKTDLALGDIIEMSRLFRSRSSCLSVLPFTVSFRAAKNPAHFGASRVGKILLDSSLPARLRPIQIRFGLMPAIRFG